MNAKDYINLKDRNGMINLTYEEAVDIHNNVGCDVCENRSKHIKWSFELVEDSPEYLANFCPNCGKELFKNET